MKNKLSLFAAFLSLLVLLYFRVNYRTNPNEKTLKITTWDSFGYYSYLPGYLIYDDVKELTWVDKIDSVYGVSGGDMYQAGKVENGNYVFKYLGGVALLELPFFAIGHVIAKNTQYPADGFSAPYQYALAYGVILYFIFAIFLLRNMLLRYFNDFSVACVLLLLILATNLIQYVGIDSGQSHGYIFPLYALLLYFTLQWHIRPSLKWTAGIGLIMGLATICRPTEAIMIFIPILWNTHTKTSGEKKWALVRKNSHHLAWVILFGLIGVLPQLIYWKSVTGSFFHDVGSKWVFFNPYFRVLFGWETGWFIYTPVALFFVLGLFFMKKYPFQKSILVFGTLNIWIVIAWFDWKYGSTYSTRALVQSYPVFAFPLAIIIEKAAKTKWKYALILPMAYLIFVNLFQIIQYNNSILHSRDMNKSYYSAIYLNPSPTPLDMSLLDTDEILSDFGNYTEIKIDSLSSIRTVTATKDSVYKITTTSIRRNVKWLKVNCVIKSELGFGYSYLGTKIKQQSEVTKTKEFRLYTPIAVTNNWNEYEFFVKVEQLKESGTMDLYLSTYKKFEGKIKSLNIFAYSLVETED